MITCKLKKLFHIAAEPSEKETYGFVSALVLNQKKIAYALAKEHPDKRFLHDAVKYKKPDIAGLILKAGADPNKTKDGYPLLIIAAAGSDEPMVKLLLDQGADVNQKDTPGSMTALMYACKGGYDKIAMLLLEHGANVNNVNVAGYTVMDFAAGQEKTGIVKLLLDQNPPLEHVSLAIPQAKGNKQVVSMLKDWLETQNNLTLAAEKAEFLADTDCSKPLARAIAVPRKLKPIRAGMAVTP